MKVLTNKDIRNLIRHTAFILMVALLSGQLLVLMITKDYKKQMLLHDYEVAGYIINNTIEYSKVPYAFTSVKSQKDVLVGKEILERSGYHIDTTNRFLPTVEAFQIKYGVILLLYGLILSLFILYGLFLYLSKQQNSIDTAEASIHSFMSGNTQCRIDSYKEGSLYKLFASVNLMATSLSAHYEAEKKAKVFLKNTIADVSHQLKTPLAALKMYNEIMNDDITDLVGIEKFVGKTQQALEQMEVLIQNLLKITRLDAGTILLDKKYHNLGQLMLRVANNFETRAQMEKKTITIEGNDSATLLCDFDWMVEALGNIVKNALDHTDENATIELKWVESAAITKITIKDNGKGIAADDIHHIFKRFYRSRFSQDKQGVGLGLALTKSIIELHHATIWVKSEIGAGSCFHIDFLKLTNL